MLQVQLAYFDKKGNQKLKEIKAKTEKGILSKVEKFSNDNEIYRVVAVSPILSDNEYINSLGWANF